MQATKRPLSNAIVVISDFVGTGRDGFAAAHDGLFPKADFGATPRRGVIGGYLERLPLAVVHEQLAAFAEIWDFHGVGDAVLTRRDPGLTRRSFPLADQQAPFHCEPMLEFIERHGAPKLLCVWGLGVSEAALEVCRDSFIIYNSIDAPALRVPPEVSRHFHLVLTGAEWQSAEVEARHPGMATAVMPIGPEFASPETFFPIAGEKRYDVIYVAAAQPYKRHDVLFDALKRSKRRLRALCVIGYGEHAEALQQQAEALDLAVDFVGPPGVSHAEVNRLMNLARVGVVCGVDDGAPAILTEYMLTGLPVVANAGLKCGLQYITAKTGIVAPADRFELAIAEAIEGAGRFSPRQAVLDRWAWPNSIRRLRDYLPPSLADLSTISLEHFQGHSVERPIHA